jgi:valyl-tRNA synthetase
MNLEENQTMEDLLKQTLMLAAESSANLLEMLERIVDSAEYDEDTVTLDPEIMDEARNFLHQFKPSTESTNTYLH